MHLLGVRAEARRWGSATRSTQGSTGTSRRRPSDLPELVPSPPARARAPLSSSAAQRREALPALPGPPPLRPPAPAPGSSAGGFAADAAATSGRRDVRSASTDRNDTIATVPDDTDAENLTKTPVTHPSALAPTHCPCQTTGVNWC